MGKLKFTLSNILFWLAIVASCLLLEDVAFFTTNLHNSINNTLFFVLFAIAFVGYISYFVIEHIKNRVGMDYLLLALITFGLVGALIAIWSFNGIHLTNQAGTRTFDYAITTWEKVTQSLSTLVFILAVYSTVFYLNKNYPSIRKIKVIFFIIVVICYVACIYSFIFEFNKIAHKFMNVTVVSEIKSIFWNANMFCGMMLMGILAAIGINYYKKNVLSYVSIFFLEFMLLIGASITASLVSIAVLVFYFLIEIILDIMKKKRRGFIFLAIYLFIIVGFILVCAISLKFELGEMSNFFRSVYDSITIANYNTFTGRTFTWKSIFSVLGDHPMNLIFGFGFRNSNNIIGSFWYLKGGSLTVLSAHSGYLQVLMNFGIIGVLIYGAFLVYYFYCFVRLVKKELRFAFLYLLMGFAMLVYGTMESVLFFIPNTQGILVGIAFFLPMINRWKHFKHPQLGDDTLKVEKPQALKPNLICQSLAKIFIGLFAALAALYAFAMFRDRIFFRYLILNSMMVVLLAGLTIPFITSCLSIRRSRKPFILISVLNFLLIAGVFGFLIVRYYMNDIDMMENSKWVYYILLALVLIGECIFFGVGKRQSFKDYSYTLLGMSKNSFMGLMGVSILIFITYFLARKMDIYTNPLVLIGYELFALLTYFLFSYFAPFKDQKEIIAHYNSLAIYDLKREVVTDRLGVINEKHRD